MNKYDYQNLHNTYTHAFIMDTVIHCPWELKKPQPSVVTRFSFRCCLLKSHGSWWELGQRKCVVTRWLASLDWTPQARKHGESARRRVPQWTNCRSTQSFLQEWAVHLTGAGMPLFDFEWAGNQSNMIYTPQNHQAFGPDNSTAYPEECCDDEEQFEGLCYKKLGNLEKFLAWNLRWISIPRNRKPPVQ